MFGDIALHLLKMMGHSGTVPSALAAEDVQPALARLEKALAEDAQSAAPGAPTEDEDGEPIVSLSHRALPLIALLKAAAKAECHVMWESNGAS
jgi:hypothetical protein